MDINKIVTRDGSVTFTNSKFGEAYHSITVGAIEEAITKYSQPANVEPGMNVLDFCFGLGYNSLGVLEKTKDVTIIGIELDKGILNEILDLEIPVQYKENYNLIRTGVLRSLNGKSFVYENTYIKIIIGDGTIVTKDLNSDFFNVVLFDPFSPGKHPELWSLDVFKEMFRIMKSGGRLTTYSCATWIRNNMREVGFEVVDGPIFGRKSPSTIAIKP